MAKTILITGASSGLGAGMAREFAKKGYNLAICARRQERLDALKQELESQFGIKVIAKTLDVTHYDVKVVVLARATLPLTVPQQKPTLSQRLPRAKLR